MSPMRREVLVQRDSARTLGGSGLRCEEGQRGDDAEHTGKHCDEADSPRCSGRLMAGQWLMAGHRQSLRSTNHNETDEHIVAGV